MTTTRMKFQLPCIGQIRKGLPKSLRADGKEQVGKDLGDRFRIVFHPGADRIPGMLPAEQTWIAKYGDMTPQYIEAMLPFASVDACWQVYNEAYQSGRLVAQANDGHYLSLRDPNTGEWVIKDGKDEQGNVKPWRPGDTIEYSRNGRTFSLGFRPVGRLQLWLPIFERLVTMELRTTSYYDKCNITNQLAAVQAIADSINGGNAAGIPLLVYRRQAMVTWNKPDGSAARVEKWLVNVEVHPDFVKGVIERMRKAASGLTAGAMLPALDAGHEPLVIDAHEAPEEDAEPEDQEGTETLPSQDVGETEPVIEYATSEDWHEWGQLVQECQHRGIEAPEIEATATHQEIEERIGWCKKALGNQPAGQPAEAKLLIGNRRMGQLTMEELKAIEDNSKAAPSLRQAARKLIAAYGDES